MSLNKFMHPRNPFYNNPPNFDQLAKLYPQYAKDLNKLNFKDASCLKTICCALLKHLYGLEIELPLNHLIPRVPQRLNYILWVEDLLSDEDIKTGIDIGCGASCIFGLLVCSLHKNSKILCSDIDDDNIEWARRNVTTNKLDDKIEIFKVRSEEGMLDFLANDKKDDSYDFLVCNPPFYDDEQEVVGHSNRKRKRKEPNSINTAKLNESVFDQGGEVEFVKRIIDESITFSKKIKVYTTMLGKKKSLAILKNYLLNEKKIENISETQFCQGRTMRWGIAWSLNKNKKLVQVDYMKTRKIKEEIKQFKPIFFELDYSLPKNEEFIFKLKQILIEELKFDLIKEEVENDENRFEFFVNENTWSNQRAKRRKKLESNVYSSTIKNRPSDIEKFKFYLKIQIKGQNSKISFELNNVFDDDKDVNVKYKKETRECLSQIVQFIKNIF